MATLTPCNLRVSHGVPFPCLCVMWALFGCFGEDLRELFWGNDTASHEASVYLEPKCPVFEKFESEGFAPKNRRFKQLRVHWNKRHLGSM